MGSTRAARSAGTTVATGATAPITPATVRNVPLSVGLTPKSEPRINRVNPRAAIPPASNPKRASGGRGVVPGGGIRDAEDRGVGTDPDGE